MGRYVLRGALAILLVVACSATSGFRVVAGASAKKLTPIEAAQDAVRHTHLGGSFYLIGTRHNQRGTVVLFSTTPTPRTATIGYVVTHETAQGAAISLFIEAPPEDFIPSAQGTITLSTSIGATQSAVVGWIQRTAIKRIEVLFSDHTWQVDTPTKGLFLLMAPGAATPCRLWALSATGTVIEATNFWGSAYTSTNGAYVVEIGGSASSMPPRDSVCAGTESLPMKTIATP